VVLGATGGAGSAVVAELAARGRRVRAVSRSGRGTPFADVEHVSADAADPSRLRDACRDAAVVYHCVNIPYSEWPRRLLPIADAVVTASAEAGARLVVIDNLYMYGPTQEPMTETTPRRPQGKKGRLRARLEEVFLDAHRSGRLRVTIGRASDFYGPGAANSGPMLLAVRPPVAGRGASWLGTLDAPHTLSYLPDVAWGLATLGEREEAFGDAWHLPAAEPLTGRQFIELLFLELKRPPRMRVIGRPMMRLAGLLSPIIRETLEVLYQFERPFIMDAGKFERAFGQRITPHAEAMRHTIEVMRRTPRA